MFLHSFVLTRLSVSAVERGGPGSSCLCESTYQGSNIHVCQEVIHALMHNPKEELHLWKVPELHLKRREYKRPRRAWFYVWVHNHTLKLITIFPPPFPSLFLIFLPLLTSLFISPFFCVPPLVVLPPFFCHWLAAFKASFASSPVGVVLPEQRVVNWSPQKYNLEKICPCALPFPKECLLPSACALFRYFSRRH